MIVLVIQIDSLNPNSFHWLSLLYIAVSGYEWLLLQMAYICAFYMEACFLKVKI